MNTTSSSTGRPAAGREGDRTVSQYDTESDTESGIGSKLNELCLSQPFVKPGKKARRNVSVLVCISPTSPE